MKGDLVLGGDVALMNKPLAKGKKEKIYKLHGYPVSHSVWLANQVLVEGPKEEPTEANKLLKKESREALENNFYALWLRYSNIPILRHHHFNKPRSRHEFDFAIPELMVAIEIEGGTRDSNKPGRHNRHEGYREDCIKYNMATLMGWRVLRLTSDMVNDTYVKDYADAIEKAFDTL